ncbi:MAG: hypothetical protein WKG00_38705 [Polyangiaceae bacterium]
MRRPAHAAAWLAIALAGCAPRGCGEQRDQDVDPAPPPPPPAQLPSTPQPLRFGALRGRSELAVPAHCHERAPPVRADVPASVRVVAEPSSLSALLVAEASGNPPHLDAAAVVDLDPEGASRPVAVVPWFETTELPRLGRTRDGRWLAAVAQNGDGGATAGRWRGLRGAATPAEVVGSGDGLQAIDLACGVDRCALLTTRVSRVAAPGAEVRIGAAGSALAEWRRVEIGPAAGSHAESSPFALCSVEPNVTLATMEGAQVALWRVDGDSASEAWRLPAPHGVAEVLDDPPLAVTFSTAVDDDGCAPAGANLRIERPGKAPLVLASPTPPVSTSLRRLGRGALLTWIAPLACGAERKVVFAVVLDAAGAPLGEVMPIGDATGFAVASEGASVDLWVHRDAEVAWMRLACAAP